MTSRLDVRVARIETLAVDAIVNPANSALAPGGGADGAIRAAAGPDLKPLLDRAGGLAEGAALVTPGFRLPARWILHTVAPIWRGTDARATVLAQCYASCLEAAAELNLRTVAFPAIGAGAYGWPMERACEIAVGATAEALARFTAIETVVFCCFTEPDAEVYRRRVALLD